MMKIIEQIQHLDKEALFNSLFESNNGALPKLFYIGPILLGLGIGMVFLTLPHSFTGKANAQYANAIAQNLQEDINLISENVEKTSALDDMSKKEMIQEEQKKSFLGDKARQQVEKSPVAKSDGQFDQQTMVFDSALNREVYQATSNQQHAFHEEIDPENMDDLSYAMTQIKRKRKSAYTNPVPKNKQVEKSNFATTETERLARLAAAKNENRRRRAAIDKSQTQIQAEAYQRAIQDNEKRYRHFYGLDEKGQPIDKAKTTKVKSKAIQSQALTFSTAIGAKDNLKLTPKTTVNTNPTTTPQTTNIELARLAPSNQIPLLAVIDQAQKIKSGDKVQLRIVEEGLYQNLFIPQNTILYGLCQVQKDRIQISVPSINLDGEVLSSSLRVYDADGMEGIYVDGTFNDWTKDAVQEGLAAGNSLGIRNSLGNFSLKLGRKANNRTRVYVPGGYQVYLYESN